LNFFTVPQLYLHHTPITIDFDILKYINKILKMLTQYIFNAQQRTTFKKSVENLDSFRTHYI